MRKLPLRERMTPKQLRSSAGGRMTAAKYGPAYCEARALKGGQAILAKYGPGFYAAIARLGWKKRRARKRQEMV